MLLHSFGLQAKIRGNGLAALAVQPPANEDLTSQWRHAHQRRMEGGEPFAIGQDRIGQWRRTHDLLFNEAGGGKYRVAIPVVYKITRNRDRIMTWLRDISLTRSGDQADQAFLRDIGRIRWIVHAARYEALDLPHGDEHRIDKTFGRRLSDQISSPRARDRPGPPASAPLLQ